MMWENTFVAGLGFDWSTAFQILISSFVNLVVSGAYVAFFKRSFSVFHVVKQILYKCFLDSTGLVVIRPGNG